MKRKLIVLISVCVALLSSCIFTSALETGGRCFVDSSKKCGNGKYVYERLNGQNIQLRMMYLKNTGEWAYCVDFGNSLLGENGRTSLAPDNSAYWNGLSNIARRGISLAALYGYPNNSFGVTADDAYAATQVLIWEFQSGIRPTLDSNTKVPISYRGAYFNTDRFSKMLNGTAGMNAYNALVDLVYKHDITPSFDTLTLTFDEASKEYLGTFIDKNSVLEGYCVNCSNDNVNISCSGSALHISCKTYEPDFALSFERKSTSTSQPMLVLNAENAGQECIIGSDCCPVSCIKDVHVSPLIIPMHKIGIYKVGETFNTWEEMNRQLIAKYSDSYLANCKVEIRAAKDIYTEDGILRFKVDSLVDTVITTDKGAVYSRELYEGPYYLVEVETPNGFVRSNEQKKINLSSADDYLVCTEIHNSRIKPLVSFCKSLEDADISSSISLLPEVSFGLYLAEDYLGKPAGSLLEVIHPLGDGTVKSTADLPLNGHYYIKELTTAKGYKLNTNKYYFDFDLQVNKYTTLPSDNRFVIFDLGDIQNLKEPSPPVKVEDKTPLVEVTPILPVETPTTDETPLTNDSNKVESILLACLVSFMGLISVDKYKNKIRLVNVLTITTG